MLREASPYFPRLTCYCGQPVVVGSRFCPECARHEPGASRHTVAPRLIDPAVLRRYQAVRDTSPLALLSAVAGVVAWFAVPLFGALVAVWAGHRAREEIRASRGRRTGGRLALAGLVLGYGQLGLVLAAVLAALGLAIAG